MVVLLLGGGVNGLERGQRSTGLCARNLFLEVQPSHKNMQHITAYGPSFEVRSLMNGWCLLSGTAYD